MFCYLESNETILHVELHANKLRNKKAKTRGRVNFDSRWFLFGIVSSLIQYSFKHFHSTPKRVFCPNQWDTKESRKTGFVSSSKCVISRRLWLPFSSFSCSRPTCFANVSESEMKKEINDLRASDEIKNLVGRVHVVRYFITWFFFLILPYVQAASWPPLGDFTTKNIHWQSGLFNTFCCSMLGSMFLLDRALCKVLMPIDYYNFCNVLFGVHCCVMICDLMHKSRRCGLWYLNCA